MKYDRQEVSTYSEDPSYQLAWFQALLACLNRRSERGPNIDQGYSRLPLNTRAYYMLAMWLTSF